MQLKDKIGLITGATTGIGLATAKRAFEEGATTIAITGQNKERLKQAEEELSAFGKVIAIQWRAEELNDTKELVKTLTEKVGRIDFVFGNAGVCWPTPIGELKAEDIQQQFMVNFTAPMVLIQSLVPLMDKGGAIALTTSCLNQLGIPGYGAYSASKAALRSLARTLSAELLEKNIRINTIAPGPIETPIHNKFGMEGTELDGAKSYVASLVPLGRFGETDEIANVAVMLLSDSSRYMLGEEINVDGGWANL